MKKYITIISIVLLSSWSYGQQDSQNTQYMYNVQTFNPGYVGTTKNVTLNGSYRAQWVGIDGAPQTFNISLNAPLKKGMGIGVSVLDDRIGPIEETNFLVDLAYRLQLTRKIKLSIGIKGGLSMMSINIDKLNVYNPNDVNLQNVKNNLTPNVGAGAFLYGKRFYVGLSAPNLVRTNNLGNAVILSQRQKIHANIIAGYVFQPSAKIKFKPAAMIRYVDGAPLSWNLAFNTLFNDRYTLGLGYQWKSSVNLLAGIQVNKRWFIGYSYDMSTTSLRNYNSGSHEIFMRVYLGKQLGHKRITSPRFF